MRPIRISILAALAGVTFGLSSSADQPRLNPTSTQLSALNGPILVVPEALEWKKAPASLPPGARMAVVEGDPTTPDKLFTLRLKVPAGYKIMPHWHPADEHVTVISGSVAIGHGETFDEKALKRAPAGSYFALPAGHRHFAMAHADSVIQLHGVGAWAIHYVDPAHDPGKPRR